MSTDVTAVVNHYPSPQNGFITTTSGSVSSGATTVGLNSVAGYTNGQIVVFVVDPADPTKKQTFTGVMDTSGVQVTSVKWTAGTNQTHALGATVVDYATATHIAMMSKGDLVHANQDGTLKSGSVTNTQIADDSINPNKLQTASHFLFDFVGSGCVWSGDAYGSTLAASMTAGTVYIGGKRVAVSLVTARAFTASKDTYIDVDNAGTITYTEVANNAASPALSANNIRLGIIVTGAGNIAAVGSVNQGQEDRLLPIASSIPYAVTDSLGNLICPRDPNRRVLGYRQIVTDFTLSAAQTTPTQVTGLSCPVIVPTGRKVKVTFWTMAVQPSSGVGQITIWDGTVNSGTKISHANVPTSNQQAVADCQVTPSATSKTYNAGLHASALSNITVLGSTVPMFIRVELV